MSDTAGGWICCCKGPIHDPIPRPFQIAVLADVIEDIAVSIGWNGGNRGEMVRLIDRLRKAVPRVPLTTDWQPPETAPITGEPFLAELSNGCVVILHATESIKRGDHFLWWGIATIYSVPYKPSHPADTDWLRITTQLTGWQHLPKSRQQPEQEPVDVG